MNIPSSKKLSIIIFIYFLTPSVALAHGNPMFVFSLVGIALFHLILVGFLFFMKMVGELKIPLTCLYLINLVFCWLWAWDYRGPHFDRMFIGLILGPPLTFAVLIWIVKKLRVSR